MIQRLLVHPCRPWPSDGDGGVVGWVETMLPPDHRKHALWEMHGGFCKVWLGFEVWREAGWAMSALVT